MNFSFNKLIAILSPIVLTASISFAQVKSQANQNQKAFDDANQAVAAGSFDLAIKRYQTIRDDRLVNFAPATTHIATIMVFQNRYREAIKEYKKVLAMNPKQFMSSAVTSGLIDSRLCVLYWKLDDKIGFESTLYSRQQSDAKRSTNSKDKLRPIVTKASYDQKISNLLSYGRNLAKIYDIEGRDLLFGLAYKESNYSATIGFEFSKTLASTQQYRSALNVLRSIKGNIPSDIKGKIQQDSRHYADILRISSWPKDVSSETIRAMAKYKTPRLSNFNVVGM